LTRNRISLASNYFKIIFDIRIGNHRFSIACTLDKVKKNPAVLRAGLKDRPWKGANKP
jgi:hypothetical protein